MKAKIRDTELFFDVEGASIVIEGTRTRENPVAFLLHGGPGADHTSYKPIFSALADRMQLVYIDHRGQGRSARGPQSTYTLDHNVEDLEALRHHLGLDQIIIIGGSYGGMVALAYAARYPNSVSHLMVYATVASYEFLATAQQTLRDRGPLSNVRSPKNSGTAPSNRMMNSKPILTSWLRYIPIGRFRSTPIGAIGFCPTKRPTKPLGDFCGPMTFDRNWLGLQPPRSCSPDDMTGSVHRNLAKKSHG
jgi:pimeloyl-ACP methyl ester carboxylesterase